MLPILAAFYSSSPSLYKISNWFIFNINYHKLAYIFHFLKKSTVEKVLFNFRTKKKNTSSLRVPQKFKIIKKGPTHTHTHARARARIKNVMTTGLKELTGLRESGKWRWGRFWLSTPKPFIHKLRYARYTSHVNCSQFPHATSAADLLVRQDMQCPP
jgi:hypothetical protein